MAGINRTKVINAALMRAGAHGVNNAFEGSSAAQTAAAAYLRTLDFVLSLYPWTFAMRLALLPRSAESPAWGGAYAYSLPADCVRLCEVRIWPGEEIPSSDAILRFPSPKYSIVGRELVTDADAIAVSYVSNNDVITPSESFLDALEWRLAFEIAQYVEQGNNAGNFLQLYEQALDMAKMQNDAQENPERVRPAYESRLIAERFN